MSGPVTRLDRVVIERGASVMALAMLTRHQEQELAVRERGRLISMLIGADAAVDEHEAAALAADLGFDRRHVLRLPLVALRGPGGIATQSEVAANSWGGVWREVAGELATRRVPAVVGLLPRTPGLGVIVAIASPAGRAHTAEQVSQAIREAAARKLSHVPLTIAVGDVARSWAAAGAGLREALGAGQAALHAPSRPWHDATVPDLGRLLFTLRDHGALRTFVQRSLDGIIDHDRGHHSQFLATIEAYCEHAGRMAETARALHLQRQSLYKRLARIEALLDGELADAETRLGLHLALVARRYMGDDPAGPH